MESRSEEVAVDSLGFGGAVHACASGLGPETEDACGIGTVLDGIGVGGGNDSGSPLVIGLPDANSEAFTGTVQIGFVLESSMVVGASI